MNQRWKFYLFGALVLGAMTPSNIALAQFPGSDSYTWQKPHQTHPRRYGPNGTDPAPQFRRPSQSTNSQNSSVFTLFNRTSSPLIRLYASPSGARSWEQDIMGGKVLRPGQSVQVTINDGRGVCIYDIRGDFADGDKVEDYKVNVCTINTYRFFER